jgi:hypothetical protein
MSMMEQLRREEGDRVAAAKDRYRAQLARVASVDRYRALLAGDADGGGDAAATLAALRVEMVELGLTAEDVERDVAALAAHSKAAAGVLTADQEAEATARAEAEFAAIRAEATAAVVAWLRMLSPADLVEAARAVRSTLFNIAAGRMDPRLTALDETREWGRRVTAASSDLKY